VATGICAEKAVETADVEQNPPPRPPAPKPVAPPRRARSTASGSRVRWRSGATP
jgi:hypothetical protein